MSNYFNSLIPFILPQIIILSFFLPTKANFDSKSLNDILLSEINKYRYLHNVKKLSLDSKIINDAQVYAESLCKHSDPYFLEPSDTYYESDQKYGENLFQCNKKTCKADNITIVSNVWYNETHLYDYKTNKGIKGTYNFTQMVWKGTKKMGCGIGYRNDESYKVVCFFYPKGNVEEKYKENVLVRNNTKIEEEVVETEIEYNNYEEYISQNRSNFIKVLNMIGVIMCILLLM